MANIVHGFAAMGHHPGDALLVACTAQAAERVTEADPQGLANTLWGFAKVSSLVHEKLLATMPLLGWMFSSRRNCEYLYAMSQLQFNPGGALLRAYEAAAVRRAVGFNPQHVVRVASTYTRFIQAIDRKAAFCVGSGYCSAKLRWQSHVLS